MSVDKKIKYQETPQLVKSRKDGKRPGYRGEAAAASDAAAGRDAGRSGPGAADDRGSAEQNRNQRAQVRAAQVRAAEKLIDRPTFGLTGAAKYNLLNPKNIFSGILSTINPLAGLLARGVGYLSQEVPETLGQFKDSNTLQEFVDKVRGYGITNPTISNNPMFGGIESLAVNPQTLSVNPQITRDLFAFNPGSVKDRALKQQYGIYNATGMMNPNMIDLMKQDIELNKQKGTPLSLPAEAYSLIG